MVARKTTPRRRRPRSQNGADPVAVLLEDMRSQLSGVAEAVLGLKESTDRQFAVVFETMDRRFDAVDRQFAVIDKRFETIDRRFDHVDHQLVSLRQELARKADAATLAALDQRVTALERGARA